MSTQGSVLNTAFWFHLLLVVLAWVGPFLFSWNWMLMAYGLVFLQFIFLGKCVVNKMHELDDADHYTFYTFLFESVGIKVNRPRLFWIVRKPLYPLLSAFTLFWQLVLEIPPLLF